MKNKLLKIFVLLFIFITILSSVILASTLNLKIDTNKNQLKKGEEVNVIVSWSEGMQAADFSLKYDSKKLEYVSSDLEEVFINNDVEKGELKTAWFSTEDKDKTEIKYTFKAIKSGKAEFETIINGGFANGNLEVPSEYNNAKASISIKNNLVIYAVIIIIILILIIVIIKGGKKYAKNSK